MQLIIQTLLPIFFLITLGYFFKRIKFPNDDFWKYMDKFTYYVLFPSLLIYKLSTAKLDSVNGYNFVLSALLTIGIITVVLILINRFWINFRGDAFTSIYQGAIRFNTYVFLALTDALLGDSGIVLAALLMTFLIPSINVFCISIFSIYASSTKITVKSFLKSIIKNPLILACIFGGSLNYLGLSFPIAIENTLSLLSMAALPMGLLSVGVGLHLSHIKEAKKELIISSVAKLIVFPILIFLVASLLGVKEDALTILVLFAAMPTASSAYILARELGGDLKLMSAIITLQTIVSIITISIAVSIFLKSLH